MTAADFEPFMQRLAPRRVVLVNTASASGPFIEALSGPGRTIVTATRNGRESFATIFGGYFVDALTSDAADADKNKRVSVLEAFDYARREVATAYERQGIILIEHALLDDSGDKEGTATPTVDGKEGRVAALMSLGTAGEGDPLPSDPKLRALYEERRALERRVESLRLMKDSMDAAEVHRGAGEGGHRPGAQDARDSRRGGPQVAATLHAPLARIARVAAGHRHGGGCAGAGFHRRPARADARAGREPAVRRTADVRAAALQHGVSAAGAGNRRGRTTIRRPTCT